MGNSGRRGGGVWRLDARYFDIKTEKGGVPSQFRKPLREFLRNLTYVGQGMRCGDPRYADLFFIKFKYWYVLYRPVSDKHIDVIAVQYDYGQST